MDVPKERQFVGLDAYQKLIDLPDVNYIMLATPPGFRPYHLRAAVESGKTIFTEKPVATDGPGIRVVLEAAKKSESKGQHVVCGTQRRHQLGYLESMKHFTAAKWAKSPPAALLEPGRVVVQAPQEGPD